MDIQPDNLSDSNNPTYEHPELAPFIKPRRSFIKKLRKYWLIITLIAFFAGSAGGFGIGRYSANQESTMAAQHQADEMTAIANTISPTDGFKVQAVYGDVGPNLLDTGAIDLTAFKQLYQQNGQPLSDQEIKNLTQGSQDQITFTRQNARFLLNFFWALGLANKNTILDNGPIQEASSGQIEGYASTGGWTLGTKSVSELFSSAAILSLTSEQQARVEEVAKAVYRPCCNNPTHFPDCNHGMAMLGLLELMASQNATTDEMLQAAKSANAFWFPQQTLEQAIFFKATQKTKYPNIDAKLIVGQQYSSLSGFQNMHQWLSENGLLEQTTKNGNNCGV
jgi:hypothetical protein